MDGRFSLIVIRDAQDKARKDAQDKAMEDSQIYGPTLSSLTSDVVSHGNDMWLARL